jgi:cyclophilin family peptidyl-prolyl cis-trans isomerase
MSRTFTLSRRIIPLAGGYSFVGEGGKFIGELSKEVRMAERQEKSNPSVVLSTNMGDIRIELFAAQAPVTTKNFLDYASEGFYDGLIFHRVIPGFMVQGGGFDRQMKQKATKSPIKNEAANGLKNRVGSIAMARTSVVDSATAQFFINVKDNTFLDHRNTSSDGFGYAVFGHVAEGMDVVQKIEQVKTASRGSYQDVPVEPVVIHSVRVENKEH